MWWILRDFLGIFLAAVLLRQDTIRSRRNAAIWQTKLTEIQKEKQRRRENRNAPMQSISLLSIEMNWNGKHVTAGNLFIALNSGLFGFLLLLIRFLLFRIHYTASFHLLLQQFHFPFWSFIELSSFYCSATWINTHWINFPPVNRLE